MIYTIIFLLFITVFLLSLILLGYLFRKQALVGERLEEISKMEDPSEEEQDILRKPLFDRIIQPSIRSLGNFLGNLTPAEIKHSIEQRITYAGRPKNISYNNLMIICIITGIGLPLGIYLVLGVLGLSTDLLFLLMVVLAVLGFYLPIMSINSKARNRKSIIQKTLPDLLDLLLVSVEAGLGFDMAMKRVTEKKPGELSAEMKRALEEIRVGKTRSEALRGIYDRTGVEDVRTFVSSIIQAEQLGANITQTLSIQADTMRERRRQRAEAAAMKAPVKMIFPLVFFIFPALMVVLLGPAAIRIFQTLMSGAF